jgi:hypothetical protein
MRREIHLVCAVAVSTGFISVAQCGESPSDMLPAEVLEGWRRLEAAGAKLEAEFIYTECIPRRPERLMSEGRVLVNGPSVIFHSKRPVTGGPTSKDSIVEGVLGTNPGYAFELRGSRVGKSFILTSFQQPNKDTDEKLSYYVTCYAGIPWTVSATRLWDMRTDPRFKVESLTPEDGGLVRMKVRSWKVLDKESNTPVNVDSEMVIHLDPAIGWAIRSFETTFKKTWKDGSGTYLDKGSIDYSSDAPAFPPVPRRHVATLYNSDGSERVTYKAEFPKWKYLDRVDEQEFGLAAFGLPEPVGHSPPNRMPTYLWLIAAAALCALLGAAFRYLARRKPTLHHAT